MKLKSLILLSIVTAILAVYLTISDQSKQAINHTVNTLYIKYLLSDASTIQLPNKTQIGTGSKSHFIGINGPFILVGEDQSSLRYKPQEGGKTIKQLAVGQRLTVVDQFTDDTDIAWSCVTDVNTRKILGWVDSDNLIGIGDFQENIDLTIKTIDFCKDDYCSKIYIKNNNQFRSEWKAIGGGLELKGQNKGVILGYKNDIIWAKKKTNDKIYDFFIITNGVVEQEPLFENHYILTE
tara:strand:+ start:5265 stop:5975 length:711 start_codon:yes stop_codon:yes gene_type:complete